MNTYPPQFKQSQIANKDLRLSAQFLNPKTNLNNHPPLRFAASLDPKDGPSQSAIPSNSSSPIPPPDSVSESPPKSFKKWLLKLGRFKFKNLFNFKSLFSSAPDSTVLTGSPSKQKKPVIGSKNTFIPKVEQLYPSSPLEEPVPKPMDTPAYSSFEETYTTGKPLAPLGLWSVEVGPSGVDFKSSLFNPTLALTTDTILGDSLWGSIDVKETFKESGKSVPPSDTILGSFSSAKETLPMDIPDIMEPIYVSPPTGISYSMVGAALMGGLGFVSIANPAQLAPPEYQTFVEGLMQGNPDETFFVQEMPKLLNQQPLSTLHSIAGAVESFFDFNSARWGHHPNEAELMLLLKHPELSDRDPSKTYSLTKALTSITRFINTNTPLTDEMVKAWGDIGTLSHSFRFWRFDTIGGKNSLFEKFGFKPLNTGRAGDAFGKGFLYRNTDNSSHPGTTFEFRRGYLLATHPDHGTLVIRNSSPAFGRDLMKHPAYYLPMPFSPQDIEKFNPNELPENYQVLNHLVYKQNDKDTGAGTHLAYLTEAILGLKEEYRRFKLDTRAFEGYRNQRKFVGHLSPGLPHLIQQLETFQQNHAQNPKNILPDLAFVHPDFPIYSDFGQLKLTPERLKELKAFSTGTWSVDDYPQSQWIEFLKKGVDNRGELVMVLPDVPSIS